MPLPSDDVPLEPASLMRLLRQDFSSRWTEADASLALRQQLQSPLFPDLVSYATAESYGLEGMLDNGARKATFAFHLTTERPDIKVLTAIKGFAKKAHDDITNPLSYRAAEVMYFAAIAAAWVGCRERVTQLPDAKLREGFSWAARQQGGEQLKTLFDHAIAAMS